MFKGERRERVKGIGMECSFTHSPTHTPAHSPLAELAARAVAVI